MLGVRVALTGYREDPEGKDRLDVERSTPSCIPLVNLANRAVNPRIAHASSG